MPSRTRPRGKSRFENGPTIHAKKTKPATESAFLSKRSGSGGYEEFMKFLNNDVENFCSEIRDMCRSDYTAQQFVDAICNAQLNRRDDGEASDSASPRLAIVEVLSDERRLWQRTTKGAEASTQE